MIWTPKIEKAIRKASILHKDQKRKRGNYPYLTHLFSVACILSEYTDDEDVIVSGLLHDSVEDTEYTLDELESDFGSKVKDIVEGVSIPYDSLKKSTWREEREAYIESLKSAPEESLMVSAADKIHNMHSVYSDYSIEDFEKDFDDSSISERIEIYQRILETISERLDSPIVDKLEEAFKKYKEFLNQ